MTQNRCLGRCSVWLRNEEQILARDHLASLKAPTKFAHDARLQVQVAKRLDDYGFRLALRGQRLVELGEHQRRSTELGTPRRHRHHGDGFGKPAQLKAAPRPPFDHTGGCANNRQQNRRLGLHAWDHLTDEEVKYPRQSELVALERRRLDR